MSETDPWHDGLLPAVLQRDERAMTAFVEHFSPLLRSVIRSVLAKSASLTGPRTLQEDLLQDIFVCLFDRDCYRLRQFDGQRASLKTFLGIIARRYAIDQLRSHDYGGRLESLMADDELFAYASASWDEFERFSVRHFWRTVRAKLVATLSREDLIVLEQSFEDEASGAELARVLETTEAAVHARRSRLRKRIIELIDQNFGQHPEQDSRAAGSASDKVSVLGLRKKRGAG